SYRVDLPHTGPWLFAADAADLAENFTDRKPPGRCVLREDWPRAIMSIERLLEEKERLGARLVPGHDQLFWDAVKHPPGGYEYPAWTVRSRAERCTVRPRRPR